MFGWTFTINPQTLKDVYFLHPVNQTIVNKISHFVWHEEFVLLQKQRREIKEFGKLKTKLNKIQLPGFANKTRISKSPLNTTKRLTKT